MKVVILCGGKGTRIRDVADNIPKPMIPIGDYPILWHIMKSYSNYGYNEFILCIGYLGWQIKEYFLNYNKFVSDFTLDMAKPNEINYENNREQIDWKITFVETGKETMTGGRIFKILKYIGDDENFMLTYGDGLSNVNIENLVKYHVENNKICTVTGVSPPGRFGEMKYSNDNIITQFEEKPENTKGKINGGFFVIKTKGIEKYLSNDENLIFEREPLAKLANDGELIMFNHDGFWQPMDTFRDYNLLNNLWSSDNNDIPWL